MTNGQVVLPVVPLACAESLLVELWIKIEVERIADLNVTVNVIKNNVIIVLTETRPGDLVRLMASSCFRYRIENRAAGVEMDRLSVLAAPCATQYRRRFQRNSDPCHRPHKPIGRPSQRIQRLLFLRRGRVHGTIQSYQKVRDFGGYGIP